MSGRLHSDPYSRAEDSGDALDTHASQPARPNIEARADGSEVRLELGVGLAVSIRTSPDSTRPNSDPHGTSNRPTKWP